MKVASDVSHLLPQYLTLAGCHDLELVTRRMQLLTPYEFQQPPINPELLGLLKSGVAYHHAGLNREERQLVEHAYRTGVISVLVATTTVAAGVNLPARRVIFLGIKSGGTYISNLTYRQMSGRAGRTGQCKNRDGMTVPQGESIMIISQGEQAQALQLMKGTLPALQSALYDEHEERDQHLYELTLTSPMTSATSTLSITHPQRMVGSSTPSLDTLRSRGMKRILLESICNGLVKWRSVYIIGAHPSCVISLICFHLVLSIDALCVHLSCLYSCCVQIRCSNSGELDIFCRDVSSNSSSSTNIWGATVVDQQQFHTSWERYTKHSGHAQ